MMGENQKQLTYNAWIGAAIEQLEKALEAQHVPEIEARGEDLLHVISTIHLENKLSKPLDIVKTFFEKYRAIIKTMALRPFSGTTLYVGLKDYVDFGISPGDLPLLARGKEKRSNVAREKQKAKEQKDQERILKRRAAIKSFILTGSLEKEFSSLEKTSNVTFLLKKLRDPNNRNEFVKSGILKEDELWILDVKKDAIAGDLKHLNLLQKKP